MLKKMLTSMLCIMMILSQTPPVFAQVISETPATHNASGSVITQDDAGNRIQGTKIIKNNDGVTSSEDMDNLTLKENDEAVATLESYTLNIISDEAEPLLYCLLLGEEWNEDKFGKVAFSEWINTENKEFSDKWKTADDLYKAYLAATDEKLEKDKQKEALNALLSDLSAFLDEKNAIEPEKDKKTFEELLPGLYLVVADGFEPQLAVVSQEDVDAELVEIEEEKPEDSEEAKKPADTMQATR